MKPRQQKAKRRERSVSRFIVTPMLGLLLVEILLLLGSITVGGVLSRLRENADAMLAQQVVNRRNYLENYMTSDWSELSALRSEINAAVRAMQQNGELDISAFGPDGSGAGGSALLTKIAPDMISALYAKHLSGIYVILNAQELPEGRAWETAAGHGPRRVPALPLYGSAAGARAGVRQPDAEDQLRTGLGAAVHLSRRRGGPGLF